MVASSSLCDRHSSRYACTVGPGIGPRHNGVSIHENSSGESLEIKRVKNPYCLISVHRHDRFCSGTGYENQSS